MTRTILGLLLMGLISLGACKENKNTEEKKLKKEGLEKSETLVNKQLLVGSWLDTSESQLHFSMLQDGTARSDNMATLLYQKWRVEGSKLILTVKSIGNGSSSIDEESYEIKTLTEEKLVLQNGDYSMGYTKKMIKE
ncbi:lipocalin family protein [Marinifilum sp. D737]|uniref:lipocalin family protein n=1 Tax=Marinifilum sp. D737 TaxID=2969628 RepID=UPI0022724FB2|nr:lipocalin family protein [Marinifilum sp. D737]MCY1635514.1 lipocalin family protein [Marinifilum sp. D737]